MARPYYPVSRYTRRQYRSQATMLRLLGGAVIAGLVGLALLSADLAHAAGPVVSFSGGIGVQPATFNGTTAVANTVNDTQPAGRPWVISDLKAQVAGDGSFDIRGTGLIFAGGGTVGRGDSAGGPISVRARLYCGTGGAGGKFTSDESVQLAVNGDFRLTGQFAVVQQPLDCPNAVLLILNAGASAANPGGWFAAGIPK